MKILTYNINSVRLRSPRLASIVEKMQPDIVCLQETKVEDSKFPYDAIRDMGFEHIHIHGMKSYNGVAILSKSPFTSSEIYHRVDKEDCRHISIHIKSDKFKKDIEIHNLYIPAGGDEPDININKKFKHKLEFVDEINNWFSENYSPSDPLVVLGDFNIAPMENDVWSHKQLLKVISHTPIEVEKLTNMQKSLDWVDAIRYFVPEDEKCYSWWSYRNRDWRKSNRGRRLDHIWITKPLKPLLKSYEIDINQRDGEKPSDHVPVMINLDI